MIRKIDTKLSLIIKTRKTIPQKHNKYILFKYIFKNKRFGSEKYKKLIFFMLMQQM